MDPVTFFIFELIVLVFSVMIHEISHGFVAERLGDPTARDAGRLTLNPIKHIDLFGSIILPLILALMHAPILGWAKPVPYNPMNLKNPKSGAGKIAAAGPFSNFLLALVFGLFLRGCLIYGISPDAPILSLFAFIAYVNISLGVFNLLPIPPLDGSKVLVAFLPQGQFSRNLIIFLERNGIFILILFILFGFSIISPIIGFIFTLMTGQPV